MPYLQLAIRGYALSGPWFDVPNGPVGCGKPDAGESVARQRVIMGKFVNRLMNLVLVLVLVLVTAHYIRNSSPFDGVWLAEDGRGDTYHPAEMRLSQTGNQLKMNYVDRGGMSFITWTCDGIEHPLHTSGPFLAQAGTYSAKLNGALFEFTQKSDFAPGMPYIERWSIGDVGKRLFVRYGERERLMPERTGLGRSSEESRSMRANYSPAPHAAA
jgi:hypothetical protein